MSARHLVIALIVTACARSDAVEQAAVPHRVLAPDLSIGEMTGDDALLFARITGTALDPGGRIYVADTEASEVRVFGPDGRFLFGIGRSGAGPGEFDGLCCLAIDDAGLLWVRDGGNARFTAFEVGDTAARVARAFPMATASGNFWAAIRFTGDGRVVQVGHRPGSGSVPDQVLLHTDTTGQVGDSVRIPATPADSLGLRTAPFGNGGVAFLYPPFGPLELVAHGPGGQYAKAVSSAYRVAWYDAGGALLRVLERADVIGPELTPDERARAEDRVMREAERFNLSATERARVPDRRQPLSALFFDEAGRLWVQPSTSPDEPPRADVFAPDGTLAFTAEWPAGITLTLPGSVGDDLALGIAIDSLGIQRVVRLPLR